MLWLAITGKRLAVRSGVKLAGNTLCMSSLPLLYGLRESLQLLKAEGMKDVVHHR